MAGLADFLTSGQQHRGERAEQHERPEGQRSRLYEQLDVSNHAQALMAALRIGLIHSDATPA